MNEDYSGRSGSYLSGANGEPIGPLVARASRRLKIAFFVILVLLSAEAISFESLGDMLAADDFTDSELETKDQRVALVSRTQEFFRLLVLVPLFLRWAYLIQKENRRLFPSSKYGPAWTCWSFFVPFVNFIVPFKALKQVRTNFQVLGHGAYRLWWLTFLGSGFLTAAGNRVWRQATSFAEVLDANRLYVFGSTAGALSAWLAIKVVGGMTDAVVSFTGSRGQASFSHEEGLGSHGGPLTHKESSGKYEA